MNKDIIILLTTIIIVGISFIFDRNKTWEGMKKGVKILKKLLPQFLLLLALVSIFLGFISQSLLSDLLGKESGSLGVIIAAAIGSISLIPGPIVYPLAGELLKNGVSFTVLAAFITTLMMVGILTFPVEKEYMGTRLTIIRNILSLLGALLISLLIGVLL